VGERAGRLLRCWAERWKRAEWAAGVRRRRSEPKKRRRKGNGPKTDPRCIGIPGVFNKVFMHLIKRFAHVFITEIYKHLITQKLTSHKKNICSSMMHKQVDLIFILALDLRKELNKPHDMITKQSP